MKIKIIASGLSERTVENKVNAFISENNIEVVEMQYSSSTWSFSVMIVYKELYSTNDANNNYTP